MESKSHPNGENHVGEKREVVADDPLLEEVKLADIIWMKIRGHPWWPAQVCNIFYTSYTNKQKFLIGLFIPPFSLSNKP